MRLLGKCPIPLRWFAPHAESRSKAISPKQVRRHAERDAVIMLIRAGAEGHQESDR